MLYHVYKYTNTILLAYCFSQIKNVAKKIENKKKAGSLCLKKIDSFFNDLFKAGI